MMIAIKVTSDQADFKFILPVDASHLLTSMRMRITLVTPSDEKDYTCNGRLEKKKKQEEEEEDEESLCTKENTRKLVTSGEGYDLQMKVILTLAVSESVSRVVNELLCNQSRTGLILC